MWLNFQQRKNYLESPECGQIEIFSIEKRVVKMFQRQLPGIQCDHLSMITGSTNTILAFAGDRDRAD